MHALYKTQAIVLKKNIVKESDLIVQLLDIEGKKFDMRVFGVLASNKRSNLLWEAGTILSLEYYDSDLENQKATGKIATFKEGKILNNFKNTKIKFDYSQLCILSFLLELSYVCSLYGNNKKLFVLLKGAINEVDNITDSTTILLFLIFFETRLLNILGLLGDLEHCSTCGKNITEEKEIFWTKSQVEFHCKNCNSLADKNNVYMNKIITTAKNLKYIDYINKIKSVKFYSKYLFNLNQNLYEAFLVFTNKQINTYKNILDLI